MWIGQHRVVIRRKVIKNKDLKMWFDTSNWLLYNRKLKYKHFTPDFRLLNNLCKLTALEHKFKR